MENVSMCWIMEEENNKAKEAQTIVSKGKEDKDLKELASVSEEESTMCGAKEESLDSMDISKERLPIEATAESERDKIQSQKEEEDQAANRSAHTLVDINFKIKKGDLFDSICVFTYSRTQFFVSVQSK